MGKKSASSEQTGKHSKGRRNPNCCDRNMTAWNDATENPPQQPELPYFDRPASHSPPRWFGGCHSLFDQRHGALGGSVEPLMAHDLRSEEHTSELQSRQYLV